MRLPRRGRIVMMRGVGRRFECMQKSGTFYIPEKSFSSYSLDYTRTQHRTGAACSIPRILCSRDLPPAGEERPTYQPGQASLHTGNLGCNGVRYPSYSRATQRTTWSIQNVAICQGTLFGWMLPYRGRLPMGNPHGLVCVFIATDICLSAWQLLQRPFEAIREHVWTGNRSRQEDCGCGCRRCRSRVEWTARRWRWLS